MGIVQNGGIMSANRIILLGVNIDHCATLREARYKDYDRHRGEIIEPDPLAYALEAERAGADGITVHPREDQRHIKREDVKYLKNCLQVPLNMEMACTEDMVDFALDVLPASVCLVPENREEVTTEGGLDVAGQLERVRKVVKTCQEAGMKVSLFIDSEDDQITAAAEIGADYVELHTGAYANAYYDPKSRVKERDRVEQGAKKAQKAGLIVNLGHGINYTNIGEMREILGVREMNIGHSILSRSLFTGVREAVREMKQRMNPGKF